MRHIMRSGLDRPRRLNAVVRRRISEVWLQDDGTCRDEPGWRAMFTHSGLAQPTVGPTADAALSRPKCVGWFVPLHFLESAKVRETQLHLDLRTLLYQLLSEHLGLSVTVGSDPFVYLDASTPKRCIAPDVYAKATPRSQPIRSCKAWERGAGWGGALEL